MARSASATQGPLLARWRAAWEPALEAWSRFTKLAEPRWCLTAKDEKTEGLSDSFAMIRLLDHAVVISLCQVHERGLDEFPREILAHEIGHHVYTPADLRDNARLLARVRAGLPTQERWAGLVANLYTDLLINDRLQRGAGLNMAGVYQALAQNGGDRLWNLYLRIYEVLWSLPTGTLAKGALDAELLGDATLGARVIRAYAKDWQGGAGRFAALCLSYLVERSEKAEKFMLMPWSDTINAGAGDVIPDGLSEISDEELEGAIHPALDPDLTGIMDQEGEDGKQKDSSANAGGRAIKGGQKNRHRDPREYVELMKSVGVKLGEDDIIIRYYRERALPHLIKFPAREVKEATDPLPESLDQWDVGSPVAEVDWLETVIQSPVVIPGITTVRRLYGTTEGHTPQKLPVDLYLGIDCSGSMLNPRYGLSYPVLAGAIILLSALRTGARVKVTLSGESPGEYSETDGFIRNEREVMKILTGYLGTGYAFGILRLKDTFLGKDKQARPVHILVVTDSDIFAMLGRTQNGWEIAAEALEKAGGGGTFVLNISPGYYDKEVQRLRDQGWNVHFVTGWEQMIAFARAFSKAKYELK